MTKLLISPYSAVAGSFSILGDLPLREALLPGILYWDKVTVAIALPGNFVEFETELEYLISQGAVERYNVQSENAFVVDQTIGVFARDFLQRAGDDQYSLMCPEGDRAALVRFFEIITGATGTADMTNRNYLELTMRDTLPAPPIGVAFQDILEFKASRGAELMRLNHDIDEMSVQLSSVADVQEAVRVAKQRVENSLADIDRVYREKWSSRVLSTLRMNLESIGTGAIGGAVGAAMENIDLALGAAATGMAKPVIQAVLASYRVKKIPERAAPYLFGYQAGQELQPRP